MRFEDRENLIAYYIYYIANNSANQIGAQQLSAAKLTHEDVPHNIEHQHIEKEMPETVVHK